MPKRHTHAKKSQSKKRVNRPSKISLKKSVHKSSKRKRAVSTKKTASKKRQLKVVAKVRSTSKQKLFKSLRRNKRPEKVVKRSQGNSVNRKGAIAKTKSLKQSSIYSRYGNGKKVSKRKLTNTKSNPFQEIKKLTISKHQRHDKEGKKIKEKVIPGYRQYFRVDLPKGDFEQTINTIRNGNFDFLNEGLNRNKPIKGKGSKEPRAVIITIETSYRGAKHYHRKISDIDFIVRKDNVKKLILERMVDYQDDWLERADENEDYLQESGKAFNPKNITGIDIEFVY